MDALDKELDTVYGQINELNSQISQSNKKIEDLKIKVITTDFHTLRSKIISRKSGYKQMSFYTSKSNSKLAILNYTREFFALISNIVLNY